MPGNSLVEVEAPCGGSDVEVFLLHSDGIQIHQVPMHLPVSWRRVPAAHCQDPQALQRLPHTEDMIWDDLHTIHQQTPMSL